MHLITISVDIEEWIYSPMPDPDLAKKEDGVLSMYTIHPDKYMALNRQTDKTDRQPHRQMYVCVCASACAYAHSCLIYINNKVDFRRTKQAIYSLYRGPETSILQSTIGK